LASRFEGLVFDALQRLGETLFDGADLVIDDVDNSLQLVKEISVPRFFPLYYEAAAAQATLNIQPPKGRVWIIHDFWAKLDTDANVADRVWSIQKEFDKGVGGAEDFTPVKYWVATTVAADGDTRVELHEAATADPPAATDIFLPQDTIILAGPNLKGQGGERIRLSYTNAQVGDVQSAKVLVEERFNFSL
jgi:hypothetical protein